MARVGERGFTLLESLAAVAITGIAALGIAGAVAASLYGTARAETKVVLAGDAANVLADLRAASAYDPALLAALSGRSAGVSLALPGARSVRISAAVTARKPAGTYRATVTATAPDGTAVTEATTLEQEAPAPGSRIP